MDALVDDPNFISAGKLSRDKKLKGLFRLVSETLYRQVVPQYAQTASHLLITTLEKLSFSHSGGQIGNNILTFIYFHDIDQGMAANNRTINRISCTIFGASEKWPAGRA